MNRKSAVRSRSNSPSSSIDSTYRRKLGKKPVKSVKSKEDVQVFTSLPPKVEGEIKCYLKLQITKINFLNETPTNDRPVTKNIRNTKNGKENNLPNKKHENVIARLVWWGEENANGSIFRPKVLNSNSLDNKNVQTTAKYMVRSGPKQFSAYLNDMKTLDVDLIDGDSKDIIGKVQLFEVSQLSPSNPIKGFFPVFDSNQVKIADIYISIQFESLQKNSIEIKKTSEMGENSRPVTPTSAANMNEFYTKYEKFEKQQLELAAKKTPDEKKIPVSKQPNSIMFNSNSYVNTLNEDMMDNNKNQIVQSLIERGLKLKQEMSKSTINSNKEFDKQVDTGTMYSYIPNKTDFLEELIDDNLNDVSRLSDPLHDPHILSALIYDQESPVKFYSKNDDEELKNLLEPPDLFNRLIKKDEKSLRHRSLSISSNDQTDDESNYRSNPRVSFEIQSSDAESSICIDRCIDVLSPQRISLLNLIQITKISIDKLQFFRSVPIQNLMDHLNRIRDPSPSHQSGTKSTNSKTKPPLALKKFDLSQLFFIEYQFPVMGNPMEEPTNPMTSQIMRVISKKFNKKENTDECSVSFDHNADYSVLFNSHSLESWWRSYVSFKIYVRPPINQSNSKAVATNSLMGPQLIGQGRLSLRNVLKSRNFKLLKRLAVNDVHGKRIGTLNVSIELSSDLEEFAVNLKKLKNSETSRQKFVETPKRLKKPEPQRPEKPIMTIQPYEPKNIEEFSLPIQMYLSINEGRGFVTDLNDPGKIYLISRLFWNKEKIKFDSSNNFNWSLNLNFSIKKSIIENMKNNFMIIEAWKQGSNSTDSLLGTIKLPLHEFYLKTNDLQGLKEFLKDGTKLPLIGIDGWISVFDLFNGQKVGEINILMAMGSKEQVLNIQKILLDKIKLKSPTKQKPSSIEHFFTFKMDDLKIHPVRSNRNEIVLDESDYFIKYSFPSTPCDQENLTTSTFNTHILSTRVNSKVEHKILIPSEKSIQNELMKLFQNHLNQSVSFEVWSKSNYQNSRERLIGRGELSMERLLSVVNNSSLDVNNRSFILPLVNLEEEKSVRFVDYDRYIGQLCLTLEYKRGKIIEGCSVISRQLNDPNDVQMSVGVLRANGLKPALANASKIGVFNPENSSIYVKFSLNFMNRPYDFKQTRLISSSLSGYSPEFFDYFDINCPLISKYNSSSKKTVSLAEQIELGQITFEVWTKYSDNSKNSSDVLLGTCTVALEPLLENRIGVRGWMPIKSISDSRDNNIGNLEVAIRFVKNDDHVKVIETGKDIGWIKPSSFTSNQITSHQVSDEPTHIKTKELSLISYQTTINQNNEIQKEETDIPKIVTNDSSKKRIKCLIEIEKATHLAKIYDEKQMRHHEPKTFISFNTNPDNLSETAQTKVCEQTCSPIWNYQLIFHIDQDYFIDETKYFILKVWHKNPEENGLNKLIGCVSVDLKPLMCGLTHLSGWYNIQDSVGNSQGQVKVNILPQENLFEIKENYLKHRKNRPLEDNSKNSFYKPKFESVSQCSLSQQSAQSSHNLNTFRSESVKSFEKESSVEEILKDKNELKIGLLEKLNELDKLNRMLKERLEKKLSTDDVKKKEPVNEIFEIKNIEEPLQQVQTENIFADQNNEDPAIPEVKNEAQPVRNLLDSFWAGSVGSDTRSEKSIQYDIINSIDSDKIEHLPPIAPEKADENDQLQDNFNDTDLDQTCNLNASYEIIPSRQQSNQSPQIETYDFVDKVIDCNKFESDEENNQDNENEDNKSLVDKNYDDDFESNDDNENLTIIVPAELNKISTEENEPVEDEQEEEKNEEPTERPENEQSEKKESGFESQTQETSSSKIPNYFLPKEDLEKTMKRLHYNYVNINQKQETESESEESDQNVKLKVKSTTLMLQNKSLLKQDLSRINKIFHTKFN